MEETITGRGSSSLLLWIYRIVLIGVGYSTVKGVHFALTRRDDFMDSFPGAGDAVYYFFLGAAAVGFVSLIGLFYFRRWGAILFALLAAVVTVVDVIVEAPVAHTLAGIVLALVILAFALLHRSRFAHSL